MKSIVAWFHIRSCHRSDTGRYSLSVLKSSNLSLQPPFTLFIKKKKKCIENILCKKHHQYVPQIGLTSFPPGQYHPLALGLNGLPACPTLPRPLPVAHFRSPAVSWAQRAAHILSLQTPRRPWLKLWPGVCHSLLLRPCTLFFYINLFLIEG